ncbi:ferric reductase like transmembrane component-domain-containing protein [Halenospora varia]|nr:ferric reductase like transmembrane component-domain-containing protein [Halenospora varia]
MSEMKPIVVDQYTAARAYFLCVIGLLFFESAIHLPLYFFELRNRGRPVVKSSPTHFKITTYIHKIITLPSFVPFLTNHHIPDLIRFLVFAGLNLLWGWNSIEYSTDYKLYGWLCIANGGLALLMASRTNLFSIILRIPSTTLLMYHRWIGLATIAHATTHFALNTKHDIDTNQLADAFSSTRIQVGTMAWVALALIFLTSLNFIRRRFFEIFYYAHALFFVFVIGALIHATKGPEFLLPGLLLWAIDRAIRFWNNFRHYGVTDVTPYAGDVVKFKVKGVQVSHPGQIAWVQIPSISFLNWHPFTIASAPGDKEAVLAIRGLGGYTKKVQMLPNNCKTSGEVTMAEDLTVLKSGVKIRMDGPYGVSGVRWGLHPVTVLVAGGIGITPGISIATHIVKRGVLAKNSQQQWHIHLLWVVKERIHIKWFEDELRGLAEILADPSVLVTLDVTIHVTGGNARSAGNGTSEIYEMETPDKYTGPGVVVQGRPNLIEWFAKVMTTRSGLDSVVNACGPRPLINEVRRAAATTSWEGCHFHVEEEVFEL